MRKPCSISPMVSPKASLPLSLDSFSSAHILFYFFGNGCGLNGGSFQMPGNFSSHQHLRGNLKLRITSVLNHFIQKTMIARQYAKRFGNPCQRSLAQPT